jgi:glucose/arabinose dehydrogenase
MSLPFQVSKDACAGSGTCSSRPRSSGGPARRRRYLRATLVLSLVLGPHSGAWAVDAVTVARGLAQPWAMAFLPGGDLLVTERRGRMRVVSPAGRPGETIEGLPAVDASGQCGLLDVALDPDFATQPWVYWSYAEAGEGGNTVAVARGRLEGRRLIDVAVIFRQWPRVASSLHCGSRLAFGPDGHLFIGLGDRFSRKDDAQDVGNHLGKVVRIARDGSVPPDNPMIGRPGARPEIWSLGHRNIQGLAVHPVTGALWQTEHGPQGGDELNLIPPGANHGWPLLTHGRNYGSGTRIGEEGPRAGFVQPLRWWGPVSIAPSGMAFVTSERYPAWRGHLLIGALRGQHLVRLELDGPVVRAEHRLLDRLNARIRDVRQGPDGWIYVLTDGVEGQILRLQPR